MARYQVHNTTTAATTVTVTLTAPQVAASTPVAFVPVIDWLEYHSWIIPTNGVYVTIYWDDVLGAAAGNNWILGDGDGLVAGKGYSIFRNFAPYGLHGTTLSSYVIGAGVVDAAGAYVAHAASTSQQLMVGFHWETYPSA